MLTHVENKVLPYSSKQLFELVIDIEKYPQFLPWCLAARVRRRENNLLVGDLIIGFKMIKERFTSRIILNRPHRIDVAHTQGPLRYLNNHWTFDFHPKGCLINFHVDFEFRSKVLQKMIEALFAEAACRMIRAFEARAHDLYGGSQCVNVVRNKEF